MKRRSENLMKRKRKSSRKNHKKDKGEGGDKMEKKRKIEKTEGLGLGNLTIFGFNLNELVKNLSGHSLEELAQNPELVKELRQKLEKTHPQTKSFDKQFGNVLVSYRINTRKIAGTQPKKEKTLTLKSEDLENTLETKEQKDKEWMEEERRIFSKKSRKKGSSETKE